MYNPILTVLMSVYNGEEYLKDAVSSILDQDYNEFKFLIIDNFSTDNSRKIIRSFRDSRIKLIELPENVSLAKALNIGLKKINTKLVARIDADDISKKNRLNLQVDFLLTNPEVALLGTNCEYIDSNNKIIGSWETCTDHYEIINSFHKHNPFAHSSVLFDREKVSKLGYYPEEFLYAQDLALWVKVCSKFKVANLNQTLVKIRIHNDQATSNIKIKKLKYIEEIKIIHDIQRIPGLTKRSIINLKIKLFYMKMFHFKKQIIKLFK